MIIISGNSYKEKDIPKTSDNIFVKNDNLLKENKKLKYEIKKMKMKNDEKIKKMKIKNDEEIKKMRKSCNNELGELRAQNLFMLSEIIKLIEKIQSVNTKTGKTIAMSDEKVIIMSLKIAARDLIIAIRD